MYLILLILSINDVHIIEKIIICYHFRKNFKILAPGVHALHIIFPLSVHGTHGYDGMSCD